MGSDPRLQAARFPRASRYNPEWIIAGLSGGANPMWLSEWLSEAVDLKPGMRVLDLGCGRALSSIFLHKEFGVQVWAADPWFGATENLRRIRDAGVECGVFPIHAEARTLPFAEGFFDVIASIDSYFYYGTDDMYLNDVLRYLRPGGRLAIAQAGIQRELDEGVPEHLRAYWEQDRPWCLHSAEWWRRHWERTGLVDVEVADSLEEGWTYWRDWQRVVSPSNAVELEALEADQGRWFTYVRAVASRRENVELIAPVGSLSLVYERKDVMRDESCGRRE